MKIISGEIIAAERVLSDFNNEKAYHANGQKVSVKFLLDDGKTYWSDNHIDNFKVGSHVEFYGGKDYNNIYLNQDTAKELIKNKREHVIMRVINFSIMVLGTIGIYASGKISGNAVPSEIYMGLFSVFFNISCLDYLSYKKPSEPKGKVLKKLKEYAKGYSQDKSFLTPEDINQTSSMIKEKEIYYKDK